MICKKNLFISKGFCAFTYLILRNLQLFKSRRISLNFVINYFLFTNHIFDNLIIEFKKMNGSHMQKSFFLFHKLFRNFLCNLMNRNTYFYKIINNILIQRWIQYYFFCYFDIGIFRPFKKPFIKYFSTNPWCYSLGWSNNFEFNFLACFLSNSQSWLCVNFKKPI